ncbi:hypothetical protein H2278_04840, partial [Campylobacter sp. W0018]|uniref:beta strand repeat-containing protein n=1 Tax=Campylobacter sp. W0018 TaxID=2735782 RepID=UPI00301C7F32|nr:hypothetical protein [Campylobacter sp. W0018]
MENFNSLNRFLNSKENLNSKSLSKKFLFSLVAVSVLATCANAQISGAGCSGTCGTVSDAQTTKITVDGANNTLIIESGGSVKPNNANDIAIEFKPNSSTTTFKNEGTIQGGSNAASIQIGSNNNNGATITTFENSGTIGNANSKFAITVWGKDGSKSTITNFKNTGTINSNTGESVFINNTTITTFENEGNINSNFHGLSINTNSTIDNIKNTGTISSNGSGKGVYINNQATITTFENEGMISSSQGIGLAIDGKSTIETLKNKGTILGDENNAVIAIGSSHYASTIKNFINETGGIIGGENSLYGIVLNAKDQSNKSTIQTFNNQGIINSLRDSIFVKNSSIENFNNQGTINSNSSNAIVLREGTSITNFKNEGLIQSISSGSYGVDIANGVTIDTFENKGIIGNDISLGVKIKGSSENQTKISTFKNSGSLIGGAEGLNLTHATITSLTNEASGIIHSKNWSGIAIYDGANIETFENKGTISSDESYGFYISQAYNEKTSTIENFTNEGIIKGYNGIRINGEATIKTLINKGTIESNSNSIYAGAVSLVSSEDPINQGDKAGQSLIGTFINDTDGKIISASNGIMVETGNKIETFINKGLVEAKLHGISFYEIEDSGDLINVGNIKLEGTGKIIAGKNGINIDGTDKEVKVEGIEVESGAMIKGGNAAIYIGGGKIINSNINIKGTLIGGNGGIINEGTIGSGGIKIESSGSIAGGIVNQGSGVISGNITNNGNKELEISNGEGATINGGIVNNGGGDLVITNQGSVGKNDGDCTIKNDSGNVVIKDWVVSTGSDGKLETVVVGGSQASNVNVDKITVDQGNLDLDQLDNLSNIITGINSDKIHNIGTNGGGEISLTIGADGKLQKKINLKAGAAGAFFRTNHSLNT